MATAAEAAQIRADASVQVQAMRAEAAEQARAETLLNTLDATKQKYLGEAWVGKSEQAQELRVQRAKRVNAMMKSAADYYRSRDSGSAAERLRSMLGIYKTGLDNRVDLARIAYAPDLAMVDRIENKVPGLKDKSRNPNDFAKEIWLAVADEARAGGPGVASLIDYWEQRIVPPESAGFAPGDAVFQDLGEISRQRARVFKEAAEFNAQAAGMAQGYEKWAARNGENLSDPTSVDRYVQAMRFKPTDIPQAGSAFIEQLGQIAADPNNRQIALADIDAQIAQAEQAEKAAKEEFLGFGPKRDTEKEPEQRPELTEYEKLVGWLSRPDVQTWAKRNGFNLGTVEDASPEILEGVRTGRYPQSMVVQGRVYTPAPDDMRAVRFAAQQLQIDPQRNIFYRTGLAGERTRRGLTEVTVAGQPKVTVVDQPEVRVPVKALNVGLTEEGTALVVADDGNYYESTDGGNTYSLLTGTPEDLQARFFSAEPVADGTPMPDLGITRVQTPATTRVVQTPATTKTYTIQEQGLLYGRDPSGGVVGIDMTPGSPTFGQRVQFSPEQVRRRTRIGEEAVAPTMVERSYLKEAQKAEKARQAEEMADIGAPLPAGTRQAPLAGAKALPREPGVEVPEEARAPATLPDAPPEPAKFGIAPPFAAVGAVARPMSPEERREADRIVVAKSGIFGGERFEQGSYLEAMRALSPQTEAQKAAFRAKLRGSPPSSTSPTTESTP